MDEMNINPQKTQVVWDFRKIIIGVVAAALILIAGVFGFPTLKNGSFLSPKKQYLLIEGKNLQQTGLELSKSYQKFFSEQMKPYWVNYSRRIQLNTDLKLEGTGQIGQKKTQDVLDTIRKIKLLIDEQNSLNEKKSYNNIALLLEGNTLLDLEVFMDQNNIGAASKMQYNKYFIADRNDFSGALRKIGVPNAPKRLITNDEIYSTIYYSDADLKAIGMDYGMFFANSLGEDQVEINKKSSYKKGDKEISCREITVKFSEEQFKTFLKELYRKITSDEKLLKMTFDNYAAVLKLYLDAGYYDQDPLMKKELLNSIDRANVEKSKAEFDKVIDSVNYPDGLTMILMVDNSGNILERSLKIKTINRLNVENNMVYRTWGWKNGTEETVNHEFNVEERMQNIVSKYSIQMNSKQDGDIKGGKQTGSTSFNIEDVRNDKVNTSVKINLDNSKIIDKNTSKENNEIKFYSEFKNINEPSESGKLYGGLSWTVTPNDNGKIKNTSSVLEAKLELPQDLELKKADMVLYTQCEDRFGIEIKIPEITEKNSVNLNKLSQSDLNKLTREIQTSLFGFSLKNQALMGQMLK